MKKIEDVREEIKKETNMMKSQFESICDSPELVLTSITNWLIERMASQIITSDVKTKIIQEQQDEIKELKEQIRGEETPFNS